LVLAEAEAISPEVAIQVREVFDAHGFIDCERSRPWEHFRTGRSRDRVPHVVEGAQSAGRAGLDEGVPGYKQFYVDVAPDTVAVHLEWSVGARGGFPGSGGGGDATPLDLAVRHGAPVEVVYDPRMALTLDARFSPPLADSHQGVILTGDCLPADGGRIHTLFLNGGQSAVQIDQMDIEHLDAVPDDPRVVDCAD
jgi:hypothetical protein